MAVLSVEKGKDAGRRFALIDDSSPTILGRDSAADVPIDDERASRQHARICRQRGEWVIEDLGSRNGILHHGESVRRALLHDGELFQIGSTVLRLVDGEFIDPLAGAEVEGTRLEELLGEEGGVLTYRGHQLAMDRAVRVDVSHPRRSLAGAMTADLLQEAARAASAAQHPSLVPLVYNRAIEAGGGAFIVSRWSEASRLSAMLPAFLALPLAARIAFFRRLAEAVLARSAPALCYPIGLRHIGVGEDGAPQVLAIDLPPLLALLRGHTADLPAFPPYLAPELAEGGNQPSWPVLAYNLGAIGYHVLTGSPPMGEGETGEILARHRQLPPAPAQVVCAELPAELVAVLGRLLEKKPESRPRTAAEILQAIPAAPTAAPQAKTAPQHKIAPQSKNAPHPKNTAQTAGPAPSGPAPLPLTARASAARTPIGKSPAAPRPGSPSIGAAQRPRLKPPGLKPPPAAIASPRRRAGILSFILWPLIWAGLFFGGRVLMRAALEHFHL